MRQLPIAYQHHDDVERPKLKRTRAEADKLRKRDELRRAVGIVRLRQQGLSRFEAEEQVDLKVWRRV